jgi:hypothetical protein
LLRSQPLYRGGGGFSPPGFSRAREEMRMRQESSSSRRGGREASPDDIERYKFIKEQHERMEEERRRHALKVPVPQLLGAAVISTLRIDFLRIRIQLYKPRRIRIHSFENECGSGSSWHVKKQNF